MRAQRVATQGRGIPGRGLDHQENVQPFDIKARRLINKEIFLEKKFVQQATMGNGTRAWGNQSN
jgi:hypothetical protein